MSYRKFIASAAAVAVVAPVVAPVVSMAASFPDVTEKTTHAEAILALVDAGIIKGNTDGTFKPDAQIKRGDAAVMVARALKLLDGTIPATTVTDLGNSNAVTQEAVAKLVNKGIVSGFTDKTFRPNETVTRGQMAKYIANAYQLPLGDGKTNFPDVDSSSDLAKYIDAIAEVGITKGKTDGTFGFGDNLKRGDFSAMVYRAENLKVAPAVKGVIAINATQVEVKFNKAVDPASLFTDGKSGAFKATVTLTTLDTVASGSLTGTLSADGKTLTVTSQNPLSKRYDVVVDGVKTTDSKDVTKYAETITIAADKTAPTIVSSVKTSASTYKVTFSEPLNSLGTVSYKFADGTAATVTEDFAPGAKEVTFTLDAGIAVGKVVTASFVGTQDKASNLLTPNPVTVTFAKGDRDGVAPSISSITQTGAKAYSVKFSEELSTATTTDLFAIAGNATVSVIKDSEDPTKYNVVTTNALDGLTTVSVAAVADLSGETLAASSKVVNFVKDSAAPKVASSAVVVDATDKQEYLEIKFDKDVELTAATVAATAGTSTKDFVTTTIADGDITAQTVAYKDVKNKKVVRVALATLLGAKNVKGATYSLDLAFAGVTSGAGVAATTAKTTFTRGEDGKPTNSTVLAAPVVSADADNNKVNVTFTGAVDGASATNVANYKVDGAVIESVTLQAASGGTQVAVLNLQAGSNTFTGVRNINVENVKAAGSTKTMLPYSTNAVSLKENVAPTVTSAKLTAVDKITFTFSEVVTDSTANDFEVLIGGLSQGTPENITATVSSANTVTVTVATIDATELSKGISLKALSTLDIADAAGNKLSVPANITVTQ